MRAQLTAQSAIRFIGEGVVMVLITIFAPEGLVGLRRYLVTWCKGKAVQPRPG
jgi:ABC-type branched-subunit amino acid transport system permease subunit